MFFQHSLFYFSLSLSLLLVFFLNDPAPTEIYTYCHTLSLHDALPISATSPTVHLVGDAPPKGRRYRVVDVFERGYRLVAGTPFDYVSKLDADQLFPPDYFERLLGFMDGEPRVAAASGVLYEDINGHLTLFRMPATHVPGSLKTYRKQVFDEMGGFIPVIGWDIVDQVKVRSLGYRTVNLPELHVLHRRRHASSGGIMRGNYRMGHGAYTIGDRKSTRLNS